MTPEQQEMLYAAHAAKAAGFKRVEIAPEDLIALFERVAQLEREQREDRERVRELMREVPANPRYQTAYGRMARRMGEWKE